MGYCHNFTFNPPTREEINAFPCFKLFQNSLSICIVRFGYKVAKIIMAPVIQVSTDCNLMMV